MPPRPIHFIIFLFVLHASRRTTYIQCALRFNTREITHSFLSRSSINHSFQSHSFARVVIKKKTLTDSGRVERSMEFAAANLIRGSLQRVTKRRQLGGRCEDEKNERNVGKERPRFDLGSRRAARATLIHRFVPPLIPSLRLPTGGGNTE